ncbi:HEAT repeat domain-containing protein [bacterium]|nr:HEAT repeat domain-containing protein [bacterium]
MNIQQIKNDIYDANHPERQYKAAYQMRYIRNDQEVMHILFMAAYEAKDPKLQQEAVRSLGILAPEKAMDAFIKCTYNSDPEKRRRAYYHLGTLGIPRCINAVLRGLLDSDESVRRAAVVSTGRLGNDYTEINALEKLINGFESPAIQAQARISIEHVMQRIGARRSFNANHPVNPSFNKMTERDRNGGNSFNKTEIPVSFMPKAF